MKKAILIVILLSISFGGLLSQERVRREYSNCQIKSEKDPELDGLYEGRNIFILNYNENLDVLHIRPSGKQVLYVRSSDVEMEKEGDTPYVYYYVFDERGRDVLIQIFLNEEYGINLFLGMDQDNFTSLKYFNIK